MRKEFWEWWKANAEEHNLYFVFNDLWRFDVPDDLKHRVFDLGTHEANIWNFSAGCASSGKVFVYGVSFFAIGRLESLRAEIILPKKNIFIINAGAIGYDLYGKEHSFNSSDDIKVMDSLGIEIVIPQSFNDLISISALNKYLINGGQYYYRLGKD